MLVGAGTVRADDPSLTVRDAPGNDPLRVVLGHAPPGAKVHPALELEGDLDKVLDELGHRGVLQVLVEGGATVAGEFHRAGLVDRYVVYLAPALVGGDDGRPLFAGPGAATIADVWRGRIVVGRTLGDDLRIDLEPKCSPESSRSSAACAAATATLHLRRGHRPRRRQPVGDSIAVNGCCLTVVDLTPTSWSADVVEETLSRTTLGDLRRATR